MQINRLRASLKQIEYDGQREIAKVRLKVNPFSFIHRHAKHIKADTEYPPNAIDFINTNLDINLIGFTEDLDKSLRGRGDLIPGDWSKDVHWFGETVLLSASGNKMMFKSRVRAEYWKKLRIGPFKVGKTRIWRNTTNIQYEIAIGINPHGEPFLQIVSANIPHFPGDIEQIIIRALNKQFKAKGIVLNFPGFHTQLQKIAFSKINDSSLNFKMDMTLSPANNAITSLK